MRNETIRDDVMEHIGRLSSAEEIFTYLLLPYDQEVLNVARLHVMKRMGQYLIHADLEGMDQDEVFLTARLALKQAHADFVESTPLKEKVFKVFTDEAAKYAAKFVGLETIRLAAE